MADRDQPTSWALLPDGVRWTSPPLCNCERSRSWAEQRFGKAQWVDLDSNGVGLFDAWTIRFDCGLEVALWLFHQGPDSTYVPGPEELANLEIHANDDERSHVLFHLGIDRDSVSLWVPDTGRDGPPSWTVGRRDDNGNECEMTSVSSRCEAEAIVREFEARGHKQSCWFTPSME